MINNTINTIRIEKVNSERVYFVIERKNGVSKYYETTTFSSSAKRLNRVLNTEIKRFTYSLESFLTWSSDQQTLRFQRNVLPSEIVTEDEIMKKIWLSVLYPALFPLDLKELV